MTREGFDLLEAAERYGDAKVAQERAVRAWKPGDTLVVPMSTLDALTKAARAYATSTRRKRKAQERADDAKPHAAGISRSEMKPPTPPEETKP